MLQLGLRQLLLLCAFAALSSRAYVPAVPTNESDLIGGDDGAFIQLAWAPSNVFRTTVSHQLVANPFYNGIDSPAPDPLKKGVLLHFVEANASSQPTTAVPWLAMISCDTNATYPSQVDDIFTLAQTHGAQAALLYSTTSEGCQINQDYLTNFDKPIDVYATSSKQGARLIENQFSNVDRGAYWFDSAVLNRSTTAIDQLLNQGSLAQISALTTYTPTPPPLESATSSTTTTADEGLFASDEWTDASSIDDNGNSGWGGAAVTSWRDPDGGNAPTAITATSSHDWNSVWSSDDDDDDDSAYGSSGATSSSSASASASAAASAWSASASSSSYAYRRRRQKRQAIGSASSSASPTTSSSSSTATASAAISYLGAVMANSNVTTDGSNGGSSSSSGDGGGGAATGTGLAMIILYAITGIVTFMFFVVILSGAIRAIRHPERYGPRPFTDGADGGAGGQTRAHGITRAILDTFPVIKFGSSPDAANNHHAAAAAAGRDLEARSSAASSAHKLRDDDDDDDDGNEYEMRDRRRGDTVPLPAPLLRDDGRLEMPSSAASRRRARSEAEASESVASFHSAIEDTSKPTEDRASVLSSAEHHQVESSAATTTAQPAPGDVDDARMCPICVCEFEAGEDVRILPCDARHRFHQECIDPWLLDVSSLCPLCRLDLSTTAGAVAITAAAAAAAAAAASAAAAGGNDESVQDSGPSTPWARARRRLTLSTVARPVGRFSLQPLAVGPFIDSSPPQAAADQQRRRPRRLRRHTLSGAHASSDDDGDDGEQEWRGARAHNEGVRERRRTSGGSRSTEGGGQGDDDDDEEAQVIMNLRAMLARRRSPSSAVPPRSGVQHSTAQQQQHPLDGAGAHNGASNSGFLRSRFMRYVANRRNEAAAERRASPPSSSSPSLPSSSSPRVARSPTRLTRRASSTSPSSSSPTARRQASQASAAAAAAAAGANQGGGGGGQQQLA